MSCLLHFPEYLIMSVVMELDLKDKVALVTGASQGLGKAMSLLLAAEGAHVAVNYRRNGELARETVREIEQTHDTEAIPIYADVGQEKDVVAMFETIDERFGRIDILINNAAYCPTCQVADMTEEMWSYTLQVNLTGTFLCSREFVRRLLDRQQPGRIVNISSQAAFRGSTTGHAPYDASKGGIVSFTVSLARELAEKNVMVNCVAPGLMHTEIMDKALRANMQKYINRVPIRRIGKPEEIARMAVFLAGRGSDYMTGATVDVSGGLAMR
ncbi:MAG: SDR family NAD(P)-dependent oxidoreductase [Planctomycetota bacterium]|jgi:3-oxoacyl-[acyl-carrier protein] reductase